MKMKSRILVTTKILAVALGAASGCAPTTGAPAATSGQEVAEKATGDMPAPAASEAPVAATTTAGTTTVGAPGDSAGTAAQSASPSAAQGAANPGSAPASAESNAVLVALRDELDSAGPDGAMKQIARFKPLCDKEGYPLVGNLVRKGPSYGPTAFCAAVRKRVASR